MRSPDAANPVEVYKTFIRIIRNQSSHLSTSLSDSLHWHSSTLNLQCRWNLPPCLWFLVISGCKIQPKPVALGVSVGQPFRLSVSFKPLARGLGVQHDDHTQAGAYRRKRRDCRDYRRLTRMPAGKEMWQFQQGSLGYSRIATVLPMLLRFSPDMIDYLMYPVWFQASASCQHLL